MLVRVLGPLEVSGDDGPIGVAGASQRTVLALLALHAGHPVGLPALTGALWPDGPPPSARNSLQSHVARLRAVLGGPDVIALDPAGYRLALPRSAVDALHFEDLLRDDSLAEALALWRGAPLPEFPGEPFHGIAARLSGLHRDALARRVELATNHPAGTALDQRAAGGGFDQRAAGGGFDQRAAGGGFDQRAAGGGFGQQAAEDGLGQRAAGGALDELAAAARADPCWERGAVALATALARGGRRGEAIETLRRHADAVVDELGLDPSAVVRRLQAAVLRGELEPRIIPAAALRPRPDAQVAVGSATTGLILTRTIF